MTKYLGDSFSVFPGGEQKYRDNYDRIFGKKSDKPDPWAAERVSELPPPREAQPAPEKPKKKKKVKATNAKVKTPKKKTKAKATKAKTKKK